MIAVTGAAGFIGSAFLWRLNGEDENDILAVDEKNAAGQSHNLAHLKFRDTLDKDTFIDQARKNTLPKTIRAVVHMGACSSTMEKNIAYLRENNFLYTRDLCRWALGQGIPFIYASSAATYGDGAMGYSDDHALIPQLKPLNPYGQSKQDFDQWALSEKLLDKITGVKFFNVFGPNEYHKGDMRSVVAKSFEDVVKTKKLKLFKSHRHDYRDGEQKRDFIYIKNAVDALLFFLRNPKVTGIFNLGTGKARSWNDVGKSLFGGLSLPVNIEYIDMPKPLRTQYQYFTQAEMGKLRAAGYTNPFTPLEESVADYCGYLKDGRCL